MSQNQSFRPFTNRLPHLTPPLAKGRMGGVKKKLGKPAWLRLQNLELSSIFLAIFLCLLGCGREEIKVYRVAKENSTPSIPSMDHPHPTEERLTWSLPDGWQEQPASGMRQGSFFIHGKNGDHADCSIIQLVGDGGGNSANVNRWRAQLELAPLSDAELAKQFTQLKVAGTSALLIDIASQKPIEPSSQRLRILAAILAKGESTWFVKMTGEGSLVALQKQKFIKFLESLRFSNESPPLASTPSSPIKTETKWKVPANWKEQPPSPMRKGSFLVNGKDELQADISITSFAGAAGGIAANINRWRGQIELPPLSEQEILKDAAKLELHQQKALIVNMVSLKNLKDKNHRTRILGIILPHNEETWFFKVMGDDSLVEAQKSALIDFIKSMQFSVSANH